MKTVAILISGRLTCEQTRLIPKVPMNAHVYCSLNAREDEKDVLHSKLDGIWSRVRCEPYVAPTHYLNHPRKYGETSAQNTMSMYYHNMRAFEMLEGDYDVVLRYRSDFLTEKLPDVNFELEPGCIYVPSGEDYGGMNDRLAFGDMNAMRVYCDIYKHVDNALQSDPNYRLHPESMLAYHLKGHVVKRFDYDCSLDPTRI